MVELYFLYHPYLICVSVFPVLPRFCTVVHCVRSCTYVLVHFNPLYMSDV